MNWLFFALFAPFVDTIILYIDRFVIEREVKDYRGMAIFGSIIGVIAGTLFWAVTGFPLLNLQDSLIIMASGVLNIWGTALYYRSLSLEETSRIIIFFKAIPIIILILSFLFLKETITVMQFVGFIVILTAVVGVSIHGNASQKKQNVISKGLFMILLVDICWALAAIIAKFSIEIASFPKILSYESWGIGIGGLILYVVFPSIRHAFHNTVKSVRKVGLAVMIVNECLYVTSKAITFYAYSLGPTALVSVIGGIQIFYGIASGLALTKIAPKTYHEDISKETLLRKLFFAGVLIVGIYLVS